MKLVVASPAGYELDARSIVTGQRHCTPSGSQQIRDPKQAVRDADVIYTDTWVSMGQEEEKEKRVKDFAGFAVDDTAGQAAPKNVKDHALPAGLSRL